MENPTPFNVFILSTVQNNFSKPYMTVIRIHKQRLYYKHMESSRAKHPRKFRRMEGDVLNIQFGIMNDTPHISNG
jgi:hypothetical protein